MRLCGGDTCSRFAHVVGEELAVRSQIGQKPLFVKGLCKVKGLLRYVAKNAVCFPLQARKVEQAGRLLGFLLAGEGNTNGLRRFASLFKCFRFISGADSLA